MIIADTSAQAGIIGLTHSEGIVGRAIRIGQRLRFPKEACYWNHAFIMTSEETLIEMGGHGAQERHLVDYSDTEHVLIDAGPCDVDFARWALKHHSLYGYVTIASLALSLITGASVEFGVKGTMICSGLVAACLSVDEWRADPSHVMPAELWMTLAPGATVS